MRPGVVGSCKNASRGPGTNGSIQGPDSGFLMPSDGGEGHNFLVVPAGSWDPASTRYIQKTIERWNQALGATGTNF